MEDAKVTLNPSEIIELNQSHRFEGHESTNKRVL